MGQKKEGQVMKWHPALLVIGLLICSSSLAQAQEATGKSEPKTQQATSTQSPRTLGEIRAALLGQEVIIIGSKMRGLSGPYRGQDVFLDWQMGKPTDPIAPFTAKNEAPYNLHGARGIVEAVELAESFLQRHPKEGVDAFGEQLNEDTMINPYFHVIVRLPDGRHLFTTNYYDNLVGKYGSLILAARVDRAKSEILQQIETLLGKVIYNVGYSKVLAAETPLTEMVSPSGNIKFRLYDVPNLTPLTITKVRYVDSVEGVVARVEFLGNRAGIVLLRPTDNIEPGRKPGTPLLKKLAGAFLTEIPTNLSPREIQAIKSGTIFRGMSQRVLYYSWGLPDKENDFGRAGKQYVYGDQYVYVQNEQVTDWQSIGR